MNSHRKFLKNFNTSETIGNYFPSSIVLNSDNQVLILDDFFEKNSKGTFIFLMSDTCDACDIQPIIDFHNKNREFGYMIFFQGSPEKTNSYRELIKNADIYTCDMREVSTSINHNGLVPMVFVLNSKQQIIANGIFNDRESLEIISWPLLYVNK
ncbi:hypothetical protein SAMN04487786_0195 [Paenisporosarcina quisquiliarum]|nr:hypothetical protein SAMN04487786_0195 [Paenisporosarcina quisquiliarum]